MSGQNIHSSGLSYRNVVWTFEIVIMNYQAELLSKVLQNDHAPGVEIGGFDLQNFDLGDFDLEGFHMKPAILKNWPIRGDKGVLASNICYKLGLHLHL